MFNHMILMIRQLLACCYDDGTGLIHSRVFISDFIMAARKKNKREIS
jgi:hypothetical protein